MITRDKLLTIGLFLPFALVAILSFFPPSRDDSYSSDTGWIELTTFSGVDWVSPSYAASNDGSEAYVDLPSDEISYPLIGTGLASLVPTGATIDEIDVRFECRYTGSGQGGKDFGAYFVVAGTQSGSYFGVSSDITGTSTTYTYTGALTTSGLSLDDTDVNASDFGFQIIFLERNDDGDIRVYVDVFEIKIYYTEAAEGEGEGEENGLVMLLDTKRR